MSWLAGPVNAIVTTVGLGVTGSMRYQSYAVVVASVLIGKDPDSAVDTAIACAVTLVSCAAACSGTAELSIGFTPVHPLPSVLVPENCVVPLHFRALGVVCVNEKLDDPVKELQDAATVAANGFSVDVPSPLPSG